ncbi:hypothetical protein LTR37_000374 [Vermiconidia calcicola]|uniref:Uncharacterized protein n=1 Tax=Vermiconidia calcicola TaxID=1690605 RepID=A0ACC3P073_9PEZI|nr:hypothetical protein LTR37_000374 [Vermiconidia calcicola]
MATTTASFNSISIPAPEDNMDTSSPANRNLDDEDIDIDFEDYTGGVQGQDDERMLEDGDPTRPGTATDDVMVDDTTLVEGEQTIVDEETMGDDVVPQEEDEELIDYDEDDLQEQPVDDTVITEVEGQPADVIDAVTEGDVDEEIARSAEDIAAKAPALTFAGRAEQVLEPPVASAESLNLAQGAEDVAAVPTAIFGEEQQHDPGLEAYAAYEEQEEHANQEDQLTTQDHATHPHIQIDTNLKVHNDAPDTPTDTGLHPMTIRYGDYHMPLFKSRRQPDGLLKDDNLASLSLAELVRNCRQQLAVKIGEEVSEDQEMILGFEHLGLMLVEDCRAAFESSLNEVLEVYLQLHHNDPAHDLPPLSLSLTPQLKFTSSFNILKQAAAGGQGMSSFGFLQSATNAQAEYYHEEYDEHGEPHNPDQADDQADQQEYDDHDYGEHPDEAGQEDFGDEDHSHHETGREHEQQESNEEEYCEDPAEGEYPQTEDQGEAAAALDDFQQEEAEGHSADALYNAPEVPDTAATGEEEKQAGSTASLAAVNGDASATANGTAGEYEDELIDWDEDDLISDFPSERTVSEQDEFSTLLTEYENEGAAKAGDLPGDQQHLPDERAQNFAEENATNAPHLGSEDFLHDDLEDQEDFGDDGEAQQDQGEQGYQDDGEAQQDEQGYQDEGYQAHEAPNEELYDQADNTYDQQHDQDFLNAGEAGYEHGPEHEPLPEDREGVEGEGDFDDTVIHHTPPDQDDEDADYNFGDDDIGFDDDDDEVTPSEQQPAVATGSPLGKRSFDEVDELGYDEDDSPEVKKVRSS